MQCKLVKVGRGMKAPAPKKAAVGAPAPGSFELHVTEAGHVTIFGVNDQGQVDISAVATLAVTSSDSAIVSVNTPTGMEFDESAVALGHADVTIVATWNDPAAGIGPFTIVDSVEVTPAPPGPVTGLIIVHSPPVVH